MTNKQIIIDGVDVSGDKFVLNCRCEKLKRKEQECEELEEQLELNTANAVVIDMAQRLYKLKQTLAEIKEIVEKCRSSLYGYDQERYPKQILQKINECVVDDDR